MSVNIPHKIRFDLFITLLGISIGIFGTYCRFFYDSSDAILTSLANFALVGAVPLTLYGIKEMMDNYSRDIELETFNSFVQKKELLSKLTKLKIINQKEQTSLKRIIKNDINYYIENKKKQQDHS